MTKKFKVDASDASHPARRTAIDIIEKVIEPLLKKGLNGERYYDTEDAITSIIMDKKLYKEKEKVSAETKKEFLVIGSNKFWYSIETSLKNAITTIKGIKKDPAGFADPESGYEPDKSETLYIYEAKLLKEI